MADDRTGSREQMSRHEYEVKLVRTLRTFRTDEDTYPPGSRVYLEVQANGIEALVAGVGYGWGITGPCLMENPRLGRDYELLDEGNL